MILITGGTGFLGRRTAELLRRQGLRVAVTGRDRLAGARLERAGIPFYPADLREEAELEAVFKRCGSPSAVVHAAALSSPWGRKQDFYDINVRGCEQVLALARRHGVERFVHISTPSLYFDYTDRFNIQESDPPAAKPPSEYTRTKLLAEQRVALACEDGLPAIILRPRGIFGPGDTAILPRLIKACERGRLRILGQGDNIIDLTYVDNVAEAIQLALEAPADAVGEVFNITNGEPVRLWHLIAEMMNRLGYSLNPKPVSYQPARLLCGLNEFFCATLCGRRKEPVLTRYTLGLLAFSQTLDISKARRLLGYRPAVQMAEAVDRTLAAWQDKRNAEETLQC